MINEPEGMLDLSASSSGSDAARDPWSASDAAHLRQCAGEDAVGWNSRCTFPMTSVLRFINHVAGNHSHVTAM